ncbi:MAG: hypothetical protein FWB92_13120 [Oscillospiraceae bacterium]|nr:hypothetical protein [Oscillospiraceae bacterium]
MSKIIIEKNNNPSAEKYYLTDEKLTLKAKGLLTQLFAIPENQHFTIEALKHLNQDGIKSIRSATKELENTGLLCKYEYTVLPCVVAWYLRKYLSLPTPR